MAFPKGPLQAAHGGERCLARQGMKGPLHAVVRGRPRGSALGAAPASAGYVLQAVVYLLHVSGQTHCRGCSERTRAPGLPNGVHPVPVPPATGTACRPTL